MEPNTVEAGSSNVLDLGKWNEKLREQRAREEAQRAAEEKDRRLSLLLQAFRS